jgi:hypothetical protein
MPQRFECRASQARVTRFSKEGQFLGIRLWHRTITAQEVQLTGYQYGNPSPESRLKIQEERPRCWGKSYEEGDRTCRGCGFQNSCKEEIFRQSSMPRPIAPPYTAPAPTRPYAFPQPVTSSIQPYSPQVPTYAPIARTAPVAQPAPVVPVAAPAPQQQPVHRYGWLHDPLYQMIHSAPPPMRTQMEGETFAGRVMKNTALAMLEKGVAELFLAIRQVIFAPRK